MSSDDDDYVFVLPRLPRELSMSRKPFDDDDDELLLPPTFASMPIDLLLSVCCQLQSSDLGKLAQTCRTWCETIVPVAAEQKLRQKIPTLPAGSNVCPCWLRMHAALDALEAHVGPQPSRTWRHENVNLQVAAAVIRGETLMADPVWFRTGQALSIEEEEVKKELQKLAAIPSGK